MQKEKRDTGKTRHNNETTKEERRIDKSMDVSLTPALRRIRRFLPPSVPSRAAGFECAYCHLGFDGDRLNCPACGGPVHERT